MTLLNVDVNFWAHLLFFYIIILFSFHVFCSSCCSWLSLPTTDTHFSLVSSTFLACLVFYFKFVYWDINLLFAVPDIFFLLFFYTSILYTQIPTIGVITFSFLFLKETSPSLQNCFKYKKILILLLWGEDTYCSNNFKMDSR